MAGKFVGDGVNGRTDLVLVVHVVEGIQARLATGGFEGGAARKGEGGFVQEGSRLGGLLPAQGPNLFLLKRYTQAV